MSRIVLLVAILGATVMTLPSGAGAASFDQLKKVTASDAHTYDLFGGDIELSGDTAIVGADGADSGGVLGGAVYILQRNEGGPNNWGEVRRLTASDAEAGDYFGISVALDGDTAIVGAYLEDTRGFNAGAAYVFQRDEGGANNWGEVAKLTASDSTPADDFGFSVAISGDLAVVGAFREGSGGDNAGAAYVYQRDEGGADNWGEVGKLTASDAEVGDQLGYSVALDGTTAVAGAFHENTAGFGAGAAYVFDRDQGGANNWGEVTKLTASDADAGDRFGWAVTVDGTTAIVGARLEDAGGEDAGAAYLFERDEGGANTWGEVTKLVASDGEAGEEFGSSVVVNGNTAIVGAPLESDSHPLTGAAYVFERDEGGPNNWGETKKLTASDAQPNDAFGGTAAVGDDIAIVGAHQEDTEATEAGAIYVFERAVGPLTPTHTPTTPASATPTPTTPGPATPTPTAPASATPTPTPPVRGDASCDGAVNAIDATFVLQFSAALLGALPCQDAADANEDELVNALDATLILQFVAGLLNTLPP